jgi:pterin-4a-carbinolamine dehydratase
MQAKAFISYRRSDSTQVAQALRVQLLQRFGAGCTFMDVAGIAAGAVWPERLDRALDEAKIVMAVIGPNWLTAADRFGRRRIDQPNDWVRRELHTALKLNTPIIPLLVGGLLKLPEEEGMPAQLRPMLHLQAFSLRDEQWDNDMANLARTLVDEYDFAEADALVMRPHSDKHAQPLTVEELDKNLAALPGWEPVETSIPRDYPRTRHELRRVFVFDAFSDAIAFMSKAVGPINERDHHPRWENQWRTVIVHLSTWDIGNRISSLDVELAHEFDAIYKSMSRSE